MKTEINLAGDINMGQTTQFDSNTAFIQVKHAILDLINFNGEDFQDDVIYTANKLNSVLRMIQDNYQSWNDEAIREFVLSKHDPLRHINYKSDQFSHKVRQIQQEMIVKFS
jgi:hypothetical protein